MGYSSKYENGEFVIKFSYPLITDTTPLHHEWLCSIESQNDGVDQHPHFSVEVYNEDKRTAFDCAVSKIKAEINKWIDGFKEGLRIALYETEANEAWELNEVRDYSFANREIAKKKRSV